MQRHLIPLACSAALMGAGTGLAATTDSHPFDVHDPVMMKRVGDPQLAPDY